MGTGRPHGAWFRACWRGICAGMVIFFLLGGTPGRAQSSLCLFTRLADHMIRYSTAQWCAQSFSAYTNTFGGITNSFSITNIPVFVNGAFVYSPAVNRLLQLSANVCDASTNSFYPSVFRPRFSKDVDGNIFIASFTNVTFVTGVGDGQLAQPFDIAALVSVPGTFNNVLDNVYGVPWIIGAKKGLPNFNQFYMQNNVQVTRKLQVERTRLEVYKNGTSSTTGDFSTNEMFIMSITNNIGYSLWNSYATNYPGAPTIFLNDTLGMGLSNAIVSAIASTNFAVSVSLPTGGWPGSGWSSVVLPAARQASPNSFIFGNFSFPFLPPSVYQFETGRFLSLTIFPTTTFDTNIVNLPNLPQFALTITNHLQAYILDDGHVIDYVQLSGPNVVRSLNSDLKDIYPNANNPPYQMWYTNASGTTMSGPNLGVMNQLYVSRTGPNVAPTSPPSGWVASAGMPGGLQQTPTIDAEFFNLFFTGGSIISGGQTYNNTNLVQVVPYIPTRTMSFLTLWQANDPLVHYLASDLNEVNGYTGLTRSDDPVNGPLPTMVQNALGSKGNIIGDDRYQPWDVVSQLAELADVDQNAHNLAYRDPLVYGSDDWSFPTNVASEITGLGQVHRGTPWQTVYLKATNILDYQGLSGATGSATWSAWTGDTNLFNAFWSAPVEDWHLASLLTSLLNTNSLESLLSVNNPNPNAWLATLNGMTALTNSTPVPSFASPPELDPLVISSNSPQAALIVNAIQSARANQPGQFFSDVGDILQVTALTEQSPFLNDSNLVQQEYDISDAAYEAIPSQLLPRLRFDPIGSVALNNGQVSVQFAGYDGHLYAIQVSTDLAHWTTLSTSFPVNGVYTFTSPVSANGGPQYYRAILIH